MSDDLLKQYDRELSFIRQAAGRFAQEHPKIADRLRLGAEVAEDPHVERMIQAFAFLSARVRQKLEDEFPEITESLLGVLYPHYLVPIPSMGIVQMRPAADLDQSYTVPARTALETDPIDDEPVRFRTTAPATLWPIEVESATLARPPMAVPRTDYSAKAAAHLRLVLRCVGDEATFQSLNPNSLRFFLKGQPQHANLLYELIFNHTLEVVLAASAKDPAAVRREPHQCLHPAGFARDEGMLPYGPRSFLGYRVLTEFFAFPQKFLFVDLTGLQSAIPPDAAKRLEIYFYLDRAAQDLEPYVTADTFQLGCTPVVNLYSQTADPIRLTHTDHEYRVAPDIRRPLAHEIYTVDQVIATSPDGEQVEFFPMYSVKHARGQSGQAFWHSSRRPAESDQPGDPGTEVYLSLVDLGSKSAGEEGWTLDVRTTCLNRDLASKLRFGIDPLRLRIAEGAGPVASVHSLSQFTPTLRPAGKQGALWRLISHLSLNHLSLVDGDDQADALREILALYDYKESAQTRKVIGGVRGIQGRRVVGRVGGGTICRGVEVEVEFDEKEYSANELFLFATVIERFLGLYCTVNSFTRMVARVKRGELRRWPPRVGEKVLV